MTAIRGAIKRISLLDLVVVAGASLVIFVVLNPWLILSPTTPTGGDTGAHVYPPDYLKNVLLPSGRLQGWSQDWFAGFPIYYFYFPLPSLVIVALDTVLPYGVAFKLVTVMGLLALPPALYFLASAMRLGRSVALVVSGAAVVFAFYESFTIYGGNVASTLAGEFAFSWSFALGFVYLGLLMRAVRGERRLIPWAAVVLALTALAHVLTLFVLGFGSLAVLRRRGSAPTAFSIWLWGGVIAAIWLLPFVVRIGLSTDMAWTPLRDLKEVFPVEIWILLPIAVAGVIWAVRRTYDAVPLVIMTVVPLIYFPLPPLLSSQFPEIFGDGRFKLWNGRLLPYWYFGVAFFAAVALGAAVVWLSRRLPPRVSTHWPRFLILVATAVAVGIVVSSTSVPGWVWVPVAALGLVAVGVTFWLDDTVDARRFLVGSASALLVLGSASSVTFIDGWARWNYEGYEAKEPWPEYMALMETIDQLPPGRVQWEFNRDQNKYGTTMALMLIPYWAGPEYGSMEGLFFESSLTVPFHFLNQAETSFKPSSPIPGLRYRTFDFERGIRHLQLYGVRYYVAYTDEAKEKAAAHPDLRQVAESPPFVVYEIADSPLVEPVRSQVSVYVGGEDFEDFALDWYDDLEALDRLVALDGPADWPRFSSLDELPDLPLSAEGTVSDVRLEDDLIAFRTTAVGIPHLVKVSYFPNWKAYGAEGPWRVTPSLMVVIPTQEEVELRFERTWVEWAGMALTGLGIVALVPFLWRRRSERVSAGVGSTT